MWSRKSAGSQLLSKLWISPHASPQSRRNPSSNDCWLRRLSTIYPNGGLRRGPSRLPEDEGLTGGDCPPSPQKRGPPFCSPPFAPSESASLLFWRNIGDCGHCVPYT